MRMTLQGENPTRDKGAHEIIGANVGGVVECPDKPDDPVGFIMAVLGVELPVGSGGCAGNIRRKVDEINQPKVLDVKECLLPLSAGF
jgi:hypothetical protein